MGDIAEHLYDLAINQMAEETLSNKIIRRKNMKIKIAKVSRQLREGVSKKTGKEYSFESFGIAPAEDTLMDINGDEFARDGRWLNGATVKGVTEDWNEGDIVKVNIVRKMVPTRDGGQKEVLNFRLPEGVEPMVQKASDQPAPDEVDIDDF